MWPNPQFPTGLVTFTEQILDGKLQFCEVIVELNGGIRFQIDHVKSDFLYLYYWKNHHLGFFRIVSIESSATILFNLLIMYPSC